MRAYFCTPNGKALAAPTVEGLQALGYSVVQGIPVPWDQSQYIEGIDLLVCTGLRQYQARMRDAYAERGVPWVAFDLPHIRTDVDIRLYTRDHSWLPDVDGLPSRLGRLGVAVAGPVEREKVATPKPKGRKPTTAKGKAAAKVKAKAARVEAQAVADAAQDAAAGYALVIGQVPRDSSHGLSEGELQSWASDAFDSIRTALPGVEIVWRPHPKSGAQWDYLPVGFDTRHDTREVPVTESVAGARVVCVLSSTVGLEALIAGKPVVAWGSSCYRELCAKPGEIAEAKHPGVEAVEALLERVAYTQWGLDELATGEPFRFILGQMGIACPVAP